MVRHGLCALICAFCFLTTAILLCEIKYSIWGATFIFPLVALGCGGLVIAALSQSLWFSHIAVPGARLVAKLSYAMYLAQKLVFFAGEQQLRQWGWNPNSYAGFGMILIALIAVSAVIYFAIERPALKLRNRILGCQKKTQPIVAEPLGEMRG
jgi:peptidoglycan/LPS O-acetylase OafA/YrhL